MRRHKELISTILPLHSHLGLIIEGVEIGWSSFVASGSLGRRRVGKRARKNTIKKGDDDEDKEHNYYHYYPPYLQHRACTALDAQSYSALD